MKTQLKQYLLQKDWMWQRMFCNFYLAKFNLLADITANEFNITDCVRFCSNDDDFINLQELIDAVDEAEDELTDDITTLRYCRPIAWQYDFVAEVSKKANIPILQTLSLDALIDAYCASLVSPVIDQDNLIQTLDEKYAALFASINNKMTTLKRNFLLILEMQFGDIPIEMPNFRQMLDYYLPKGGRTKIIQALKKAKTSDLRLTSAEMDCLAFAYYSPYFCDEIQLSRHLPPDSSILTCAADYIAQVKNFLLDRQDEYFGNDDDDDDDDDDAFGYGYEDEDYDDDEEIETATHYCAYVDPQDACLIDVQYAHDVYAHVYIEKFPEATLNNSLSDFIICRKNLLYTVELVDNLKDLETGEELNKRLNAAKKALLDLEKAQLTQPQISYDTHYQQVYSRLNSCYCLRYY